MKDQAEALRIKMKKMKQKKSAKTLAVVSGKGGVGKSNFSLNFSIELTLRKHKVLLFDMDIGMGNIDILMGRSSTFTLVDFFTGKESLKNIIMEGPEHLHYIAGGAGLNEFLQLDDYRISLFFKEFEELITQYDYIIFDMGAGMSNDSLKFVLAVDEIIVVTTPEPTSITDAYSTMKYIHLNDEINIPIYVLINRAFSEKEGKEIFKRLHNVINKFLNRQLVLLGILPDDRSVIQAIKKQVPFILNGRSVATRAIKEMADRYENQSFLETPSTDAFNFVSRLKRILFER